jgi:hypothetical protein
MITAALITFAILALAWIRAPGDRPSTPAAVPPVSQRPLTEAA